MSHWKCTNLIEEDHKKPIYSIAFNFCDPNHKDVFASVGTNRATVYRCQPDGAVEVLQTYVDADRKESYYACRWSQDDDSGAPVLLVAGQLGLVRAIDCSTGSLAATFAGHGNSINDIAVHPRHPALFVTASKDNSIRLWNLKTKTCVLVLSGEGGHTNEVLSLDWHPADQYRFLSCGMDSTVKIWSLEDVWESVLASHSWTDTKHSFPARFLQHPVFSSIQVHRQYVDCVRWLGDLCLSKSVDNRILLWKAEEEEGDQAIVTGSRFSVLQELPIGEAHMWFLRFSLDFRCSTLACGNRLANVFVFDPHAATSGPKAKLKIPHGKSCVRQTAVSYDGRTIFACCDDGTICRWDHVAGAAGSAEEEDALHNLRDAGFDDYVRRADDSGGRSSSSEDEEEEEGEEGGGVRRRRRGGSGPAGVHMQRNKGMR